MKEALLNAEEPAGATTPEGMEYYPPDLRDDLLALYTKENPDYQSGVDLLLSAISLYGKPVFWRPHPEALRLQDVAQQYSDGELSSVEDVSLTENIVMVKFWSASPFGGADDVVSLYSAIHPDMQEATAEDIQVYFADYFGYLFSHYSETGERMPMDALISYALVKNDGDVHAALWDATIATKLLARNTMSSWYGNRAVPYSGWLTTKLLEDPFSRHYTAADVAKLLPEDQYWNTESGTKDFDPANLAGIYHYLNLLATMGEFPASGPAVGLMKEWFGPAGGKEYEYGNERLQSQLQYFSESLGPVATMLEHLPDRQNTPLPESNMWIVRLDPMDERLHASVVGTDIVSLVTAGKIVKMVDDDGKIWFAQFHGSIFEPFIKVADTPQGASLPLLFTDVKHGISYHSLDDIKGYSVESVGEESIGSSMPTLDLDMIAHLLTTGEIMPVDLEASDIEKLIGILRESDYGREAILSNVSLFGAAFSDDEDISWLLNDQYYSEQFIVSYTESWSSFIPLDTVFTILHDKDFGPSIVGGHPEIFSPLLTSPDDLSWLLSNEDGAGWFFWYASRWSENYSFESALNILRDKDFGPSLAANFPDLFAPFMTTPSDLLWLLSDEESAQNLLYRYTDGWSDHVSPEDILNILRDKDYGPSVVNHDPEIFIPLLISSDDLSWLLSSEHDALIFIDRFSYWERNHFSPEDVLSILRDKDYGPSVVANEPRMFDSFLTSSDDLFWLLSTKDGVVGFLYRYDYHWDTIYSPVEVMNALKELYPNDYKEMIDDYPIFKYVPDDATSGLGSDVVVGLVGIVSGTDSNVWKRVAGVISTARKNLYQKIPERLKSLVPWLRTGNTQTSSKDDVLTIFDTASTVYIDTYGFFNPQGYTVSEDELTAVINLVNSSQVDIEWQEAIYAKLSYLSLGQKQRLIRSGMTALVSANISSIIAVRSLQFYIQLYRDIWLANGTSLELGDLRDFMISQSMAVIPRVQKDVRQKGTENEKYKNKSMLIGIQENVSDIISLRMLQGNAQARIIFNDVMSSRYGEDFKNRLVASFTSVISSDLKAPFDAAEVAALAVALGKYAGETTDDHYIRLAAMGIIELWEFSGKQVDLQIVTAVLTKAFASYDQEPKIVDSDLYRFLFSRFREPMLRPVIVGHFGEEMYGFIQGELEKNALDSSEFVQLAVARTLNTRSDQGDIWNAGGGTWKRLYYELWSMTKLKQTPITVSTHIEDLPENSRLTTETSGFTHVYNGGTKKDFSAIGLFDGDDPRSGVGSTTLGLALYTTANKYIAQAYANLRADERRGKSLGH